MHWNVDHCPIAMQLKKPSIPLSINSTRLACIAWLTRNSVDDDH
jgi:hypothetical protein